MQLCELRSKHHKQFRVLVFVQSRPEISGNSTRCTSQQRRNNPFFWNRQRFSQMFGSRWVRTPAFSPVLRRKQDTLENLMQNYLWTRDKMRQHVIPRHVIPKPRALKWPQSFHHVLKSSAGMFYQQSITEGDQTRRPPSSPGDGGSHAVDLRWSLCLPLLVVRGRAEPVNRLLAASCLATVPAEA